jgi:osmotically-inducible protein OsmY
MTSATKSTKRRKVASGGESSQRKDEGISGVIQKKLSQIPQQKIEIEINDGFVTLKGTFRTFRQKERAHRIIMGLHGVRALKDLTKVLPIETVTDRQIALHVRHALDAHAELPPGTAMVHVRDGVVTLNGHVRTAEERVVAEQVASHCRGVARVANELSVDPLDEISDEATVRAVRGALAYCEDFDTAGVTVSCADGHICLRGEVPTMLDRQLAEEIARLQAGVCSVENHVHVASEVDNNVNQ